MNASYLEEIHIRNISNRRNTCTHTCIIYIIKAFGNISLRKMHMYIVEENFTTLVSETNELNRQNEPAKAKEDGWIILECWFNFILTNKENIFGFETPVE